MSNFGFPDKSVKALEFICEYRQRNDYCPDVRGIMKAVGVVSASSIYDILNPLFDAGIIDSLELQNGKRASRTIHETEAGREFLKELQVD